MKKVENINLGGKKFTIDQDAYDELDSYLHSIEKKFSASSGVDDIVYDIETRLAELFEENQLGSSIITLEKVQKVKAIMGTPSDFSSHDEFYMHSDSEGNYAQKRLFRDPDDKVVAGVASGLTAYFGLGSPLLFRALFVAMAITGVGMLPYFLLWLFVPVAKTTSDKLSMYGEKINIETIAHSVEESLTDIKDTLEDLGKNLKNKMG